MTNKACHFSVVTMSRNVGKSSVAAAAYRAAESYIDDRTGRAHSYRSKRGVLSHELINWVGNSEALWNAAEVAETRRNARVAREIRIALPTEIPVSELKQLVRGYALWMRDTYCVALQLNIHGPRWQDKVQEKAAEAALKADHEDIYQELVCAHSNRNIHAHILFTTRAVEDGVFGSKTRALDNCKTGPVEITRMRTAWENRVNALLRKRGVSERVDLRSYADQAEAGDAPAGLVAQPHLGPRRVARVRAGRTADSAPHAHATSRKKIDNRNRQIRESWLTIRAQERELARLEESARRARNAEQQRRREAEAERKRFASSSTTVDRATELSESAHLHVVRPDCPVAQAIAAARAGGAAFTPKAEFDFEVELNNDPQAMIRHGRRCPSEEPIQSGAKPVDGQGHGPR